MLERRTSIESCELAASAFQRCSLPRESPEIEQLISLHEQLTKTAMCDLGINLATIPVPAWLSRELNPSILRPPLEGIELYCAKEQMRAAYLAKHTMPLLQDVPDGEIVDIGTRSGFFPRRMQIISDQQGYARHFSGLDLPQTLPTDNHTQWDFTKGKRPLVKHYDGSHMPYANASLAAATLNFTLHHIEAPTRSPLPESEQLDNFLSEVHRVLKPNGVLVITEDFLGKTEKERKSGNAYADTVLKIDDLFYPHSLGAQRSQEEWITLLHKHGFEVEVEKHIAGYNVVGFPVIELLLKARKTP